MRKALFLRRWPISHFGQKTDSYSGSNNSLLNQYKATRKDTLKLHIKSVHDSQKNHCCTQCDYKAFFKKTLQKHIKSVHEEGQIFPCQHCEYFATRKENLKSHQMSAHEGNTFQCPHCEYKGKKGYFERHIKLFNYHHHLRCHLVDILWANWFDE